MNNTPSADFEENPITAPRGSMEGSPSPSAPGVIVDVQGHPYGQETNTKDRKRDADKEILDRVKTGERWMILLTAIVAGTTFSQAIQSCNNNASTGKQVDKIITAANGIHNAADSFSQSAVGIRSGMGEAVGKLGEQASNFQSMERDSKQSIRNYRIASHLDLRPYVQVISMQNAGDVQKNHLIQGHAAMINSGRTTAVKLRECGDLMLISPSGELYDGELPCPNPKLPSRDQLEPAGETSLASNIGGFKIISSVLNLEAIDADKLTLADRLRRGYKLYFYGFIDYSDLIDAPIVHHTRFCGRYDIRENTFVICPTHNTAN